MKIERFNENYTIEMYILFDISFYLINPENEKSCMKIERFNENYTIEMYIIYSLFSHLWWALFHFSL